MADGYRVERDSMGELQVPADALWGAQTQRAVQNFPISGLPMPRAFIRALGLIKWATQFDYHPTTMLLIMFAILLVLGMFMDQLSMMLLTVPIFFPLAETLGFDLIWFGVIVLLALEISFTTPPFGLLLFVMKGVSSPDTTMRDIYIAAIPYMGCAILLVGLLIIWPEIALWLPGLGK